jgi:N-acyl-D-amino-acid deacylase
VHRHLIALAVLIWTAWLAASPQGRAQTGYVYNPYTGRGVAEGNGSNPYTRAYMSAGSNPYTGKATAAPANYNPYTGSSGAIEATYNSYTGRYGSRAQKRTLPGGWQRLVPITGKAGQGLDHLDEAMLRILEKYGIPGGALAIARNGKLVFARGYGWGKLETGEPVTPNALFGIASLSKSITAATILKLVDEGKLSLDDRAFKLLDYLRPPYGARFDPRMNRITIRHLLNHSGGWNRKISGEPSSFSWKVARRLRVPLPVNADQLIIYMLGEPLDFDPGTQTQYSNFGYIVLGKIIERVTGQSYGDYVRKHTLQPLGIRQAVLPNPDGFYHRGEVVRYFQGTNRAVPPGAFPTLADAAGGWSISAVDLARFLTALDGSRGKKFLSPAALKLMVGPPPAPLKPRADGTYYGLGWDLVRKTKEGTGYAKDGLLPGTRTFMGRRPNGLNWVVLFNSGEGMTPQEVIAEFDPKKDIEEHLGRTTKWPEVDLFNDYR